MDFFSPPQISVVSKDGGHNSQADSTSTSWAVAFAKKVAMAFGWKETFQKDDGFLPQTCFKRKVAQCYEANWS